MGSVLGVWLPVQMLTKSQEYVTIFVVFEGRSMIYDENDGSFPVFHRKTCSLCICPISGLDSIFDAGDRLRRFCLLEDFQWK